MKKRKRPIRHNLKKKTNKYNAKRTRVDGILFDSEKEANYYKDLKIRQKAGEILLFLRQVIFDLPGAKKYLVDFIEFYEEGTVRFVDVKGRDTATSKLKRDMVEAIHGVKIELE